MKRPPSGISLKMINDKKPGKMENFDATHVEYYMLNPLLLFIAILCFLQRQQYEKTHNGLTLFFL